MVSKYHTIKPWNNYTINLYFMGVSFILKITRVWAMPNKETFKIKPIKELLERYVDNGKGWIDPFAGNNSPAEYTNDLNPDCKTTTHYDAITFAEALDNNFQKNGCLFDPPYSLRQLKECYESIDKKMTFGESQDASFSKLKDAIAPKICAGGYVISFGWSSGGFGKNRGFEIIEILLVPHGGHHNNTIVTVEKKTQSNLTSTYK